MLAMDTVLKSKTFTTKTKPRFLFGLCNYFRPFVSDGFCLPVLSSRNQRNNESKRFGPMNEKECARLRHGKNFWYARTCRLCWRLIVWSNSTSMSVIEKMAAYFYKQVKMKILPIFFFSPPWNDMEKNLGAEHGDFLTVIWDICF